MNVKFVKGTLTVNPPTQGRDIAEAFFEGNVPSLAKLRKHLRTKPTNEILVKVFLYVPDIFPHKIGKEIF